MGSCEFVPHFGFHCHLYLYDDEYRSANVTATTTGNAEYEVLDVPFSLFMLVFFNNYAVGFQYITLLLIY